MRELVDRPSPRPMVGAGVGRLVSCVCVGSYMVYHSGASPRLTTSLCFTGIIKRLV
jgi:hypothetical protein